MLHDSVADSPGDFSIDLLDAPVRMFGADRAPQNRPRRLPHAARDLQPLHLRLLPENLGQLVVQDFKMTRDCFHREWSPRASLHADSATSTISSLHRLRGAGLARLRRRVWLRVPRAATTASPAAAWRRRS